MPPQASALVTLFALSSVALGWLAVRVVDRVMGGARSRLRYVLPILAAFGAFYLIGHHLGVRLGPEVPLFGFQVSLVGDLALGLSAALLVAAAQAVVARARASQPEPDAGS
jgi:hypothetical protein